MNEKEKLDKQKARLTECLSRTEFNLYRFEDVMDRALYCSKFFQTLPYLVILVAFCLVYIPNISGNIVGLVSVIGVVISVAGIIASNVWRIHERPLLYQSTINLLLYLRNQWEMLLAKDQLIDDKVIEDLYAMGTSLDNKVEPPKNERREIIADNKVSMQRGEPCIEVPSRFGFLKRRKKSSRK